MPYIPSFPTSPLAITVTPGQSRQGREASDMTLTAGRVDAILAELLAFEAAVAAGTIPTKLNYTGAWSSTTTYPVSAIVVGTDGGSYVSLQAANLNHAITNGTSNAWWGLFAAAGAAGVSASSTFINLGQTGTLSVGNGVLNFRAPRALTIVSCAAYANTAPTGASVIVDVNKNGTTVFTTVGHRPTIAISAHDSGLVTNMDITAVAAGDLVTFDIDQVGSTIAGADLTVTVEVQ